MTPAEYTTEELQEMQEINIEMRAELEVRRSHNTSRNYKGGAKKWVDWCEMEGLDGVIDVRNITKYMKYLHSFARVADGTRDPAYKTFEGYINGLYDLYNKRVAEGAMQASTPPWNLPIVKMTKKVLKLKDDEFLAQHPNTSLLRVFTSVHQADAMRLSSLVSPGLALLSRLFLTYGVANSLRPNDFFQLRWHSLIIQNHPCYKDEIHILDDEIGPHQAFSLLIPSKLQKHGGGRIRVSGSVRWRDIGLCPQHNFSAVAAFTFGRGPGRLTVQNLRGFVACAPSCTNEKPISDSHWNTVLKTVFEPAGVPIQNLIEGRGNCLGKWIRRYGISGKDTSGLPYELIQAGAHHTHDTTRESYLPISVQDLFHTAGFRGDDFQKKHFMYRQFAEVTEEMREIVIRGLSAIRDNPPPEFSGLRDPILGLDYCRMVLCQDIPLIPSDEFEQFFTYLPHLKALLRLPYWDTFCTEVRKLHALDIAQRRKEIEGPTNSVLTEKMEALDKKLDTLVTAVTNPTPAPPPLLPPQPTPRPPKPVKVEMDFTIQGLYTIKDAWKAFQFANKQLKIGGFKWPAGGAANSRHSTFGSGLGGAIQRLAEKLGSVEDAIAQLEKERGTVKLSTFAKEKYKKRPR